MISLMFRCDRFRLLERLCRRMSLSKLVSLSIMDVQLSSVDVLTRASVSVCLDSVGVLLHDLDDATDLADLGFMTLVQSSDFKL